VISIQSLRKSFDGQVVLDGIDAKVDAGAIVCVVGPSGCGKSTLLRCLNGLESFDAGAVDIAGFHVTAATTRKKRDLRRLRTKVGMVFQEFHLFPHLTVLDNVSLAPRVVTKRGKDESHERARALLREVGLEARAGAYPSQLSGGQKQRVAIARALALPLDVLLLDEPTSALDPEMREEVRATLREVASHAKLTMVLVTHEMRLATELGTELWVMQHGNIVERGAPKEILAAPKTAIARDFLARVKD
jgi:ABC-type polar amino acid transport system ATPase subunit